MEAKKKVSVALVLFFMVMALTITYITYVVCGRLSNDASKTVYKHEKYYRNNGELYSTKWYEYDSSGNCVKMIVDYDDPCMSDTEKYFAYSYDDLGRVIRKGIYDEDGLVEFIETYKYYDDGKYAEIVQAYDKNGTIIEECSYDVLYDQDGRIVYQKEYCSNQRKPISTETGVYYDEIEYFEIVDLDVQEYSMYNDILINYKWYNHDSDGKLRIMVEISYLGDKDYQCYITDYHYDSKGRLIQEAQSTPIIDHNNSFHIYPKINDTFLSLGFKQGKLHSIHSGYFTDENSPGTEYIRFESIE